MPWHCNRSEALPDVALVTFKQLEELGLSKVEGCSIILVDDPARQLEIWYADQALKAALSTIERVWSQVYPDDLFEYKFLDDSIAQFYEDERALQYLIQTFAFIAIVIVEAIDRESGYMPFTTIGRTS